MRLKGGSLRGYPFLRPPSAGWPDRHQPASRRNLLVLHRRLSYNRYGIGIGHAVKKGNCRGHEAAQFTRRIGGSV
jgi:hypothetical protein